MKFFIFKQTVIILILLTAFMPPSAAAQTLPVGDPLETYIRILQADADPAKTSSYLIRPLNSTNIELLREENVQLHPWQNNPTFAGLEEWNRYMDGRLTIIPLSPRMSTYYNNNLPLGQNDGLMWQGRGYNHLASAGLHIEYGPLRATLRPEFTHSINRSFEALPPGRVYISWPYEGNEYMQRLSRIDMPYRFGDNSFSTFHAGQSTLSLNYAGATAGVSTANNWSGPALHNPLLMSNNAPGFFHAFLGTDGPLQTQYGNIEARMFWGGLKESDYYDDNPANNLRFISGLEFNYSPPFLPELSVGFARTFVEYYPEDGLTFSHLVRPFNAFTKDNFSESQEVQFSYNDNPTTQTGDTAINLMSFFARWKIPQHNFEVWAEWGKNENTNDRRNFLLERVHTRSYVLGFQKRFEIPQNRWITFNGEITQIENLEDTGGTDYPVWYEHLYVSQGYTHRGQVLGAGIGPGGTSQKFRVDFYDKLGLLGFSANRIEYNNDRLYRHQSHIVRNQERILKDHWDHTIPQNPSAHDIHETEFRFGGHLLLFLPYNFEFQGDIYRSILLNRFNVYDNDYTNLNLQFTLRYQIPGMGR